VPPVRQQLDPGGNTQAAASMAPLIMSAQALLPSQRGQAPHLMCGVKGSVRALGPHAWLAAPVSDSSSPQVPHHVPHERLIHLVAPNFMLRFHHHRHSPGCLRNQSPPPQSVVQTPNGAPPACLVQPRIVWRRHATRILNTLGNISSGARLAVCLQHVQQL
jgi:hypothetical protein